MKIKLRQQVVFDGVSFPPGHVFDSKECPINAESLINREWADPVTDETPTSAIPVSEPVVEQTAQPIASVEAPAAPAPSPATSEQKPKRKK